MTSCQRFRRNQWVRFLYSISRDMFMRTSLRMKVSNSGFDLVRISTNRCALYSRDGMVFIIDPKLEMTTGVRDDGLVIPCSVNAGEELCLNLFDKGEEISKSIKEDINRLGLMEMLEEDFKVYVKKSTV